MSRRIHSSFPSDLSRAKRRITLVVDCSGSMGGDSIAQAKTALHEILALLEPSDRFNLIAFGSTHRSLFSEPGAADTKSIRRAGCFVDQLDADMDGTKPFKCLSLVVRDVVASCQCFDALWLTSMPSIPVDYPHEIP